MNWFVNWFDSPYYHVLYKNRDNQEAKYFIDNIINYLKIKNDSKIIDIACGNGRHAVYLNQLGFQVIGVDLSENNISFAKKKENEKLSFFQHDMRNPFKLNEFNLALNLFTSFGYFDNDKDNQKAMISMSQNLKKDGILIIDFMNVKKIISNLVKSEKKEINNITFKITREIVKNQIIKSIKITDNNKQYTFQEKVNILTLNQFSQLIKKAGLTIIDIFGDYKLSSFNANCSDRLILVCKNNYLK